MNPVETQLPFISAISWHKTKQSLVSLKNLNMGRAWWSWFISFHVDSSGAAWPRAKWFSHITGNWYRLQPRNPTSPLCVWRCRGVGGGEPHGVSLHVKLFTGYLKFHQHSNSVTRKGFSRESNRNHFVFDDPALEVTKHHFCHIHTPIQIREDITYSALQIRNVSKLY